MNNKRPYIICHMMSTIGGKITSGTSEDIFDDYFDLYTETEDTYEVKSLILGRVTMEMFAIKSSDPLPQAEEDMSEEDFISPSISDYFMFAVDTKGVLRWEDNAITFSNITDKLNLIVIVTTTTPKEYLTYLKSKAISYIFAGKKDIDFRSLFEKIRKKFGIEKLMIEGGGILNGSIMAQDLIDEISILITPLVVNRQGAPSVFEGPNDLKLDVKKYSLKEVKKMKDDALWLVYRRN